MDINTLRGIATLFVMLAFIGVCLWAYSGKRKKTFEQAAQLPFEDDHLDIASLNNPENRGEHNRE